MFNDNPCTKNKIGYWVSDKWSFTLIKFIKEMHFYFGVANIVLEKVAVLRKSKPCIIVGLYLFWWL